MSHKGKRPHRAVWSFLQCLFHDLDPVGGAVPGVVEVDGVVGGVVGEDRAAGTPVGAFLELDHVEVAARRVPEADAEHDKREKRQHRDYGHAQQKDGLDANGFRAVTSCGWD